MLHLQPFFVYIGKQAMLLRGDNLELHKIDSLINGN